MMWLCYQWTFTPRSLVGKGRDRNNKKGWCSLCVCVPLGGHRRTTSPSSDGSGEAGSEQGWSVVRPPGDRVGKFSYLAT